MFYNIKCIYDTGDSFHNEYDVETTIEIKTTSLELAQENLKRIKEHYEYYSADKGSFEYRYDWSGAKARIDKVLEEAKTKPWFVGDYNFSLKLLLDGGKEYQISACWCGYFEKLNSAEIVIENEEKDLLRFNF